MPRRPPARDGCHYLFEPSFFRAVTVSGIYSSTGDEPRPPCFPGNLSPVDQILSIQSFSSQSHIFLTVCAILYGKTEQRFCIFYSIVEMLKKNVTEAFKSEGREEVSFK